MKLLIVTRADSNIKEICDVSHPYIMQYALKCGADFKILDHETDCTVGDGKYHYRIMKLYELLDDYDRILHIDSDIIMHKNAPNIFEIVPEDCIGTIYEDKGSREEHRRKMIRLVQEKWGDIGWREGYINTGFFLVSRQHKEIFQKFNGEYWTDVFGFDDLLLGYQINRLKIKVFELEYRYNHMSMHGEAWNNSPPREDSYVLHYAGKNNTDRIKQMRRAVARIYENG